MENGKMSLKTVLTELSQAIQSQASVSGPLTLRQMTAAVKNIQAAVLLSSFTAVQNILPAVRPSM